MQTEINGDWKGYIKRFKLPSKSAFTYPIKITAIIFVVSLIVSLIFAFLPIRPIAKMLPIYFVLMVSIYFYIKIHWKKFWGNVLEESKGLFADLLMWLYYVMICIISILPCMFGLSWILK